MHPEVSSGDRNKSPLGLIAGGDTLPRSIIEFCQREGRPLFVVAYEGHTNPEFLKDVDHAWIPLGHVGEALAAFKAYGCKELVMAGPVKRPSLRHLKMDALGAKWLAQSAKAIFGDDSLLSIIVKNLEKEGFKVVSPESLLGKGVLAPKGPFGRVHPGEEDFSGIAYGLKVARALGSLDIGQSVVIQQGAVLGVEAAEGTNALIERCAALKRAGQGPVLIKTFKPGQEGRADRPVIGLETLSQCLEGGFRGIAVEAGEVLVLDREELTRKADLADFFIAGV